MPNTVPASATGLPSLPSRRFLLAATTIVAGAMIPAAMLPADARAAEHLDAELLALGEKLKPLYAEIKSLTDEADREYGASTDAIKKASENWPEALSIRPTDVLPMKGHRRNNFRETEGWERWQVDILAANIERFPEMRERLPELTAAFQEHANALEAAANAFKLPSMDRRSILLDTATPLEERAIALPARTVAGLAVKASIAKEYSRRLWGDAEIDMDYDAFVARRVIDGVFALAGDPVEVV
jgi:hypothetical protein